MSITVQQRDFTAPLDSEIQELLDAISDFEFRLTFKGVIPPQTN